VVDSSVILAVIHEERGLKNVPAQLLASATVSTVNLTEVQSKLVSWGWHPEQAWEDATGSVQTIVPFTLQHAKTVGNLIAKTRSLGLSLGDCACLALGLTLDAPI
jgi:PIN domain nuclease of toxin-antitoxin system